MMVMMVMVMMVMVLAFLLLGHEARKRGKGNEKNVQYRARTERTVAEGVDHDGGHRHEDEE